MTSSQAPQETPKQTPEEIQAEIEAQRVQLADTVDQLSQKLDVRSQAQARVAELTSSATTDAGRPRPEVLAAAGSLVAFAAVLVIWRLRR